MQKVDIIIYQIYTNSVLNQKLFNLEEVNDWPDIYENVHKIYNFGSKEIMKFIFNGSPRKEWNTATLLKKSLERAESEGAETELINILI